MITYPLSEREFDNALLSFNSNNALFNYLHGTNLTVNSLLSYELFSTNRLLTEIWIITKSLKVAFVRRLLTDIDITSEIDYDRRLGSQTRYSKIYLGWNRGQDMPGALYGVR